MRLTEGGRDIFERELGSIPSGLFHSPLRDDKTKPSFAIYPYQNIWVFKDQGGDGESGNAIQFIQKRYNLLFHEAKEKILVDMGLREKRREYNPIKSNFSRKIPIKDSVQIDWASRDYTDKHINYMKKYDLPVDYLESQNIFALKELALNKKEFKILPEWYGFVYHEPSLDKCKVLLLGENTPWKWRNEVPNSHIWYLDQYKKSDRLWIVKSTKDRSVLNRHFGFDAAAVQNESAKIFLNNTERIDKIAKEVVIFFGTDPQGKDQSIQITKAKGYKWFNTPNYTLKYGVEDVSDYVDEFSVSLLEKELIKKGFL
jgi:hypothetical protein